MSKHGFFPFTFHLLIPVPTSLSTPETLGLDTLVSQLSSVLHRFFFCFVLCFVCLVLVFGEYSMRRCKGINQQGWPVACSQHMVIPLPLQPCSLFFHG